MGDYITDKGLKEDKSKVAAILQMPPPTDKQGVQRLLGMATFLSRYAPIRELIKSENEILWDNDFHGKAFMPRFMKTRYLLISRYLGLFQGFITVKARNIFRS